jgi:ketosteroid isomerase-like protein
MSANVMQASELARKYIETLGAGRMDECVNLFRDDAVLLFPKTVSTPHRLSKEDFRTMLGRASSVFDGWPRYSLIHQTSESNRSCIEFRGVGKLKHGAEFEFLYCIVFVAEGGLITEMREYLDTHHMLTTFKTVSSRDPA